MLESAPNGHFLRDMIIFNGLSAGGVAAKGFIFHPPDLQNAQVGELNQFQDHISLLLASLAENQRLQIQWYCDSDYRHELLRYNDETERLATNTWSRMQRNERFTRYWRLMEHRKLRRQKLIIYISRAIEVSPRFASTKGGLEKHYELLLEQLAHEFSQVHEILSSIFVGQGARVVPMTDADHYRHYSSFLNPSLAERFDYDVLDGFDPSLSVHENCWHSEGNNQIDYGFWLDGHYHAMLVLRRWPKATMPGIVHRLTGLHLLDYTVTVNVAPLAVRREIKKEEDAYDRVAGDYASEHKLRFLTVMQKKERKVAALMQGHTMPFHAQYVIRAWDKTKEGLSAKTTAIKNAINSMNGAQYFETTLPPSSKKLFFQTWPGWAWGKYDFYTLYAENRYLADMLPISATFTGHLETAEALYDGGAGNLIGIKTFSGTNGSKAPQHAVMLGMTGAGKSVNVCDLLTQTEPYFDYTVIVEEGLSYGIYTQTVDAEAKPIIIQPNGSLTMNYLDTNGLPLTPMQLSTITALIARMVGISADEDKQMLRQAQIAKYVKLLYDDACEDWSNRNQAKMLDVARHACAVRHYLRDRMAVGATTLDAFTEMRDWRNANADEAESYLASFDEGAVLKFYKDPETAQEVRNLAFAYFDCAEYPTHRMLQELMQLDASGADKDEIAHIATLLMPWCRDGNYGALFDGTSNISLLGKIAHFELGYIPDSAKELRSAAGFLITNYTRNHIVSLPRALRKRNVYEEVARFLDIPGGESIVKESYAQLRKFNCWNIAIVQQYSRFKESSIRSAVFGNSRMFLMMKQSDRSDLDDIGRDITLPEITKGAIMSYPLPDQQVGQKFSAFTYYHTDNERPIIGTARNIASPEMLYCSSSSGDLFEKRARQLKQHDNILEGILTHARQENHSA